MAGKQTTKSTAKGATVKARQTATTPNLKTLADQIFEEAYQIRLAREPAKEIQYWVNHSRNAARFSEEIARRAGLDAERAYANGLLHDIGRGVSCGARHITDGYRFLKEKGLDNQARICLTHSFYPKTKLKNFGRDFSPEDYQFLCDFLEKVEYDDYDHLAQLADFMAGSSHGLICSIEKRFTSVLVRHHNIDAYLELSALIGLRSYFSKKCGEDIYHIFANEIQQNILSDYNEGVYRHIRANLGGNLLF